MFFLARLGDLEFENCLGEYVRACVQSDTVSDPVCHAESAYCFFFMPKRPRLHNSVHPTDEQSTSNSVHVQT